MGNITRKILLLLVIASIFVVATEGHRKRRNRHCPSRDDEDHVCCEWKTKTPQTQSYLNFPTSYIIVFFVFEDCSYCERVNNGLR